MPAPNNRRTSARHHPPLNVKRTRCCKRNRILERDHKLQANDLMTWDDNNKAGVVVFQRCLWGRFAEALCEMERARIRGWSES